jgi:hypothetical protein
MLKLFEKIYSITDTDFIDKAVESWLDGAHVIPKDIRGPIYIVMEKSDEDDKSSIIDYAEFDQYSDEICMHYTTKLIDLLEKNEIEEVSNAIKSDFHHEYTHYKQKYKNQSLPLDADDIAEFYSFDEDSAFLCYLLQIGELEALSAQYDFQKSIGKTGLKEIFNQFSDEEIEELSSIAMNLSKNQPKLRKLHLVPNKKTALDYFK